MKISLSGISIIILIFLFSCRHDRDYTYYRGAIIRGDTAKQQIALVFTGDEYADGGDHISRVLDTNKIKASFFFTGRFYRNPGNADLIRRLLSDGHYLGAHSDRHLLYCDWEKRDSLLVDFEAFSKDLEDNYIVMKEFGIDKKDAKYFLPPFEWYNDTISSWAEQIGLQLVNYTPGTLSHTDYTTPGMPNYRSSNEIYDSIIEFEYNNLSGLNGFILLIHIGTSPERSDKFYFLLDKLIGDLKNKSYSFSRIDDLLTEL